ncbi:Nn.00g029020.m01.CDS01 [Neocucurbitaria sp. VM-36]
MSSESDYQTDQAPRESSDESSKPPTRPSSRRQSRTPNTPRKRRRLESVDPSRIRKYYLEGKYNDAYRVLFNEDVSHAAARFDAGSQSYQHYATQIGSSIWSCKEQTTLFAALERLGRDDIPGIASAIGTKSIPETHEVLLLLQDAATRQGDAKVTLRDIPAAIEVGNECSEQLDIAGEALAWYQETFEASQEQERFGDYWLITPVIAESIEDIFAGRTRAISSPPASEPESPRRGGNVVAGYEEITDVVIGF